MTLLDANTLAQIQTTQTEAFFDTCVPMTRSATADSYGQMIETWTSGTAIACRFVPKGSQEGRTERGIVVTTQPMLRLPLTSTITALDKVQVTKRFGTTLATALTFAVDGTPQRGATALTVMLKDVT